MNVVKTARPWYSRRTKRLRAGLWTTSMLLLVAIAALAYVASQYSLQPVLTGDDYLLMTEKQAKECKEGGGCAIFSEREFQQAIAALLMSRPQRQDWRTAI